MADFNLNPNILQTAAGSVTGDIAQIQTAVYGREVRASIAEALYLLYQNTEEQVQKIIDLQNRLTSAEEVIYPYTYPDIDGSGMLNASDAAKIRTYSAGVGSGKYANNTEGWAEFAQENGLDVSSYPDANNDGIVNSQDAALILEFAADAGAGKYDNSAAGWNAFMTKKTQSDIQSNLQKISAELNTLQNQYVPIVSLTQAEYDALENHSENTLYVLI